MTISSKTTQLSNDYLLLVFNNVPMTLVGDASGLLGSAADGNLYVSLHTMDPGVGGDQTTFEVDAADGSGTVYIDYARAAVARTGAAWTVTTNVAENAANVAFPVAGVGSTGTVAQYFGIGTSATGAGKLLYRAALASNLPIVANSFPQFPAGDLTVTET